MTDDQKVEVCRRRLDRESIYSIAKNMDVLPQSVHDFLKNLPNSSSKDIRRPKMTDEEMLSVCEMYIMDRPLELIAKKKKTTEDEILMVFSFLKSRMPPKQESKYYPAVANWMQANGESLNTFSKKIGYSAPKLGDVLHGRKGTHMSFEMAQRIERETGLSIIEIFSEQIRHGNCVFGERVEATECGEGGGDE